MCCAMETLRFDMNIIWQPTVMWMETHWCNCIFWIMTNDAVDNQKCKTRNPANRPEAEHCNCEHDLWFGICIGQHIWSWVVE